ncbi:MAG: TIR domain-containing protein [Pseudomonadota bacterium]
MAKEGMKTPIFIGHAFSQEKMDDLREAIDGAIAALPQFPFSPVYADQATGMGHILDKIKVLIASSMFCIFDVTENDRPNIFFELGFAHGIRKPHFLICEQGSKLPSDLAGIEYLAYQSKKNLREQLIQQIPRYADIAFKLAPKKLVGHVDLIRPIFKSLGKSRLSFEELVKITHEAGFTKDDMQTVVADFEKGGLIRNEEGKYFLTPDGKNFSTQFLPKMK